ncbi:AAA-type ATPase family protein [Klebsormidium nitens]|uniref:microtubule-severing ATPase n=1 Tax=Klebsormidium nitens TaxID=105231 RepID=A0A1Y1IVK7_KLENI|nr:AAA-type ATPase family protein [Klebsormidium nitens]|eukprot:GAQ93431.1 AAA-type ATPase family protein [Klebsormidium nitens]
MSQVHSKVEDMKRWKAYLKKILRRSDPTPKGNLVRFEEQITGEIMQARDDTTFKDIGGMKQVKIALTEMVILPSVRSDIYTGLRTPPRGLLLFGPPGNGKTYIARAVANEVKATFFSISATSFASSRVGDAENLLRALFTVARKKQPSLIFIDEIDSILTKRCENDQEYTRKLKTEFFVQFDGVATDKSDRVTVIAATNLPQELDDAAVRRFEKRIYVGLPDLTTRQKLLEKHLQPNIPNPRSRILDVPVERIKPVKFEHFEKAKDVIKPSVKRESLNALEKWNADFGSFPNKELD